MRNCLTILLFFIASLLAAQDSIYFESPIHADFPGGPEKMQAFIQANLNFPEYLQKTEHEGFVFVQFTVEKDGVLSNMKIKKSLHPILDIEAIKVLERMPRWTPYMEGKDTLRQNIVVAVPFVIAHAQKVPEEDNTVYLVTDVLPKYPGGNDSIYATIFRNFNWSSIVMTKRRGQARAICRFIVEKDGSVSAPEIIKRVEPSFDAEVLRLVSTLNQWIPAKHQGKKVRCYYLLPVAYKIEN